MDVMEINDDTNKNKNLTTQGQVNFRKRQQPSRCVTVCLGLLCAVLLAANIGQIIYYVRQPTSADPKQAAEARLSNLTEERDELQQSYNILKEESDQLKTSYDNMQMNFEEMQTFFTQLQSYYILLMIHNGQLQKNYATMNISKIQPLISSRSLQTLYKTMHKDKKQTRFDALVVGGLNAVQQFQYKINKMVVQIRTMICQTGWKKFDVSCYFVSTEKKNWTSSRQECINKGADLVVINSRGEQAFINGLLKSENNAWIGLTDSLEEGTWMWVDGTPVATMYWQGGQPSSHDGIQDCGEMVATPSEQGGEWNDDGCVAEKIFICEQ